MSATLEAVELPNREGRLIARGFAGVHVGITKVPSTDHEVPLDTLVISQHGPLVFMARRWWRGWHPGRGQMVDGLTGVETVEEVLVVRPLRTFYVV